MKLTVGECIKRSRKENHMTQEDCAALIGVKRSAISKYEKGVVSIPLDRLIALSEVLGTCWLVEINHGEMEIV